MADPALIRALRDARAYPHECGEIKLLETHISWVLLTGTYAYKVKKPVDLGFLDFSTLDKRRHYCEEECRCNAVFAPEIYCGVVPIVRNEAGEIMIDGVGDAIEYAVKMRQFDHEKQLDVLLENGELSGAMLRAFAKDIVTIYSRLPRIIDDATIESRTTILGPVLENFHALENTQATQKYCTTLAKLRAWSTNTYDRLNQLFTERVHEHWIRERHGDLHLSNLVLTETGIRAFDCIEFSQQLRRIDAINDIAFLFMDCAVRNRSDLAYAFVDAYLDASGDYSGSRLLRFYAVYRSLVRAKVAAIQLAQSFDESAAERLQAHIEWASRSVDLGVGRLTLMCGISGSGKSWLAQRLAPQLGAIRIRSDIVRRQVDDRGPSESSRSTLNCGPYSKAKRNAVYDRLRDLSEELLCSGENVIVDATFLSRADRAAFQRVARMHDCSCKVVVCEAPAEVLKRRVTDRLEEKADPSEATLVVVDSQLEIFESPEQQEQVVRVRTDRDVDIAAIATQLRR